MNNILHYTKAIVGFLGALITYGVTLPGFLDLPSWVGSIGIIMTFVGVYLAKNQPLEGTDADDKYQPRHAYEEGSEPKLF